MLAKQLCGRQGRGRPGAGRMGGVGGGKLMPELGGQPRAQDLCSGLEKPRPGPAPGPGPAPPPALRARSLPESSSSGWGTGRGRRGRGVGGMCRSAEVPDWMVLLEKCWVCSRFPAGFNSIYRMSLTLLNVSYTCDPGKPLGLKKSHARAFWFQKSTRKVLQFSTILSRMT